MFSPALNALVSGDQAEFHEVDVLAHPVRHESHHGHDEVDDVVEDGRCVIGLIEGLLHVTTGRAVLFKHRRLEAAISVFVKKGGVNEVLLS